MQEYLSILTHCPLFAGTQPEDILAMLHCLGAHIRHFDRDARIFHAGQPVAEMGLVLAGCVQVEQEDYWGHRAILTRATAGELFGEVYACLPARPVPISATAVEPSTVLMLDLRKVTTLCSSTCTFHTRLVQQLLYIMATRTMALTEKIRHTSQRTLRKKLLSYLSAQAQKAGSSSFTIDFDRQALADYLGADRSALSAELGRMRDDGILTFRRNQFTLLHEPEEF